MVELSQWGCTKPQLVLTCSLSKPETLLSLSFSLFLSLSLSLTLTTVAYEAFHRSEPGSPEYPLSISRREEKRTDFHREIKFTDTRALPRSSSLSRELPRLRSPLSGNIAWVLTPFAFPSFSFFFIFVVFMLHLFREYLGVWKSSMRIFCCSKEFQFPGLLWEWHVVSRGFCSDFGVCHFFSHSFINSWDIN